MGYVALYRKYRPSNFDELVGQREVVNIIRNEILNSRISHAYLFSGPRGTGKTSTAKIIAKMINCSSLNDDGSPCCQCESCINFNSSSDVIEIDAASNNGVDEIRELRDKVNLVPTYGKYKIYIIDEVHMLTTQAFNALLKTLEEPPSHVVFILATTEFYKIPNTVVSRCQKFQFLKFSTDDIVKRLSYIAKNENILVSNDVLLEISRLSDGGLRDAINMLDQLSSFKNGELTVEDVYSLNGVISYNEFDSLLRSVHENDVIKIIEFIEKLDKLGKNLERFINDLVNFLNDILIYKVSSKLSSGILEKDEVIKNLSDVYDKKELYDFIFALNNLLSKMKNSSCIKILIITEFMSFSNSISESKKVTVCDNLTIESLNDKKEVAFNSLDEKLSINKSKNDDNSLISNNTDDYSNIISDKVKKIRINNAFATASKAEKDKFIKKWYLIEEKVSNDNYYASIAGMVNDIEALVVGKNNIIFLAKYPSLLDRLFSQIELIEQLLLDVLKNEYKVVFLLDDEWQYEKGKYVSKIKEGLKYEYIDEGDSNLKNKSPKSDDLQKIISILGEEKIVYE